MTIKKVVVEFTVAEVRHLLVCLSVVGESLVYWGSREQFLVRHKRLLERSWLWRVGHDGGGLVGEFGGFGGGSSYCA